MALKNSWTDLNLKHYLQLKQDIFHALKCCSAHAHQLNCIIMHQINKSAISSPVKLLNLLKDSLLMVFSKIKHNAYGNALMFKDRCMFACAWPLQWYKWGEFKDATFWIEI